MMYRRFRRPSLWREMNRLQRDFDKLFETGLQRRFQNTSGYPAVNIWSSEEGQIIAAEVPGVDPKDINISVVGNTLNINGTREADKVAEEVQYHRRERTFGKFARSIQLPFRVDAKNVEASFKNGVLTITAPRAEEDKPKKIKVKSA